MAASLTRFSTRGLAQVASRCMAMKTRQQLMSSSVAFKLVANSQPVLSAAMYKIQPSAIRMYSSDAKLNKTQVEERVLDILKNFDRVKENPAKPEVFSVLIFKPLLLIFVKPIGQARESFGQRSRLGQS